MRRFSCIKRTGDNRCPWPFHTDNTLCVRSALGKIQDRFGLGFSFTVRFRVRFAIRFRLVQKIKGVLNYPPPAWYGVMFSAVTTVRPSVCPSHYLPHSLYGHYIYPSGWSGWDRTWFIWEQRYWTVSWPRQGHILIAPKMRLWRVTKVHVDNKYFFSHRLNMGLWCRQRFWITYFYM